MSTQAITTMVDLSRWGEALGPDVDDDTKVGHLGSIAFELTDGLVSIDIDSPLGAKRVLISEDRLRQVLGEAQLGGGGYELAFRAFEQGVHAGSTGRADAGTSPAEDRAIFNQWWGLAQAEAEAGL